MTKNQLNEVAISLSLLLETTKQSVNKLRITD